MKTDRHPALGHPVQADRDRPDRTAPRPRRLGRPHPPGAPVTKWTARWVAPVEGDDLPARQRPVHQLAGAVTVDGEVASAALHATAHGIYEAFVNGTPRRRRRAHPRLDRVPLAAPGADLRRHRPARRRATTSSARCSATGGGAGRTACPRRVDDYGTTHRAPRCSSTSRSPTARRSRSAPTTPGGRRRATSSGADLIAGEVHDLRRRRGLARLGVVGRRSASRTTATTGSSRRRRRRCGGSRSCGRCRCARSRRGDGSSTSARTSAGGSGSRGLGPAGTEITLTYGEWLDDDGDVTQDHVAYPASTDVERTVTFQVDRGHSARRRRRRRSSPGTAPRASSTCGSRATSDDLTADDVTAVVVHTDLDRIGGFECSDDRINALHRHRRVELPRQRLRHPHRLPHPRAGRVDRRLADLRRDRRVPLRRQRLLAEVAARPRRRATTRRQGHQPRPRVPPRRRPAAGPLAAHRRLRRLGRRRRPRALDAPPHDRRHPGPRRPVGLDAGVGRLRRRTPPPPAGTSRGSPAPRSRRRTSATSGTAAGTSASGSRPANRSRTPSPPPWSPTTAPVATAYLHRSAGQLADIARILGRRRRRRALRRARRQRRRRAGASSSSPTTAPPRPTPRRPTPGPSPSGSSPTTSGPPARHGSSQLIRDAGNHLSTGFLATPFLLPVLADTGHLDVAYDLLFQDTEPSWLVMVDRGATTVWEEWGGVDADGAPHASLNHYSKGAVITFLHQYVAGLQLLEPGYRRFRVRPAAGRRHHRCAAPTTTPGTDGSRSLGPSMARDGSWSSCRRGPKPTSSFRTGPRERPARGVTSARGGQIEGTDDPASSARQVAIG